MEEKKLKKEVKMGVVKSGEESGEKKQKLTYEQLNDVCSQLYQENQKLVQRLQQQELSNMFKRLDYLFEVLKAASVIKDDAFIAQCVNEIKDAMSIRPKEEDKGEQ